MPKLLATLLTLSLLALPARADDRLTAARAAEAEFRQTHNYVNGRGLHVVPGIYELVDLLRFPGLGGLHRRILEKGFGLNFDQGKPIGLFTVKEPTFSVGAFGCVACHSGKAAGQTFIGLGNKTIDIGTIGKTIGRFEKPYRWTSGLRDPEKDAVVLRAFEFMRKLNHPRVKNLTKGLVSINHVHLWFYEQAGRELPQDVPRGGTKVPPLWGIEAKATQAGLFYDGLGKAGSIGWLALPELTAGQTADEIRSDFARIEKLWYLITKFLPPRYPFEIDQSQVARGKEVYAQACQKCHGEYSRDAAGLPLFQPPLFNTEEEVLTDADRLDATHEALHADIAASPLSDLIQSERRPRGYFATRLEAVWASFPYMHNASVPTLWDLLLPASQRPRVFSLENPGEKERFDAARVGLTVPAAGSRELSKLERRAERGDATVYHTSREGHSSKGHEFGTDLGDPDKRALIEYLKTL